MSNPDTTHLDHSVGADRLPRLAVIGAGTMGAAMASRLVRAGAQVAVWSRRAATTLPLAELGAVAYTEVAEAVAPADVVVTMLPTAEATIEVMIDGGGLDALAPDAVWAQMATIGVDATDRLAAAVSSRRPDVSFVDAPVSGSRAPAESGELLILASGPTTAARRLEPVFAQLGSRTLWLGDAGAGSRLKLVLNTWLAFQIEGAAESAALVAALGLEPAVLVDALHGSPLASAFATAKLGRMLEGDYRPDFALEWALKDLELVRSEAGGKAAPVAAAIAERWEGLVEEGLGRLDVSAARRGLGEEPADT